MKKVYILFITLCVTIAAAAQSRFQVSLPGSEATSIIQNPAGNFVVAGYTYTTGTNADILIYEIDSITGTVIRTKQFSTTKTDLPYSICNTPDGNYLMTGYISVTSSDNDLIVAKLDTGFNMIWYRQIGQTGLSSNDYGNSVEVVDNGLYAVTGTTSIGGSAKPSIIYLNDSGNIVKEFYLNTNQFASPKFKAKYFNNGTFGFVHLTNDICVVDTAGAILKNDGQNYGIYTTDILRNPANGVYVVLAYADYGSPQGAAAAICFYDSTASSVSVYTKFSVASNDLEPKQVLMDNGDYLVSGNVMNLGSGATNGILMKLNSTGDLIWAKQFTPAGIAGSVINSVIVASDGSYVIAGSEGAYPNYQMYVVKMDSSGNVCESVDITVAKAQAVKSIVAGHGLAFGTNPVVSTTIPADTVNTDTATALCSGMTGIAENPVYFSSLYPNPSNNKLHVETTYSGESIINICSVDGKVILMQRLNQRGDIDVHALSSGIYMLRINDVNGKIISQQKFVKY